MQIVNNALGVLNAARERAKGSKDSDLKDHISTLQDSLLELKEVVRRLTDENDELRRMIAQLENPKEKPEIRQVGAVNYYFVGDKGPYCQPCYDVKEKLVALSPQQKGPSGAIHRDCLVCQLSFYETHVETSVSRLGGRRSFS